MRLINQVPARGARLLLAALPFALLLAVYMTASTLRLAENADDKLLPSIGQMAQAVQRMAFTEDPRSGDLLWWKDTGASLQRLGLGLGISALAGLTLGVAAFALWASLTTLGAMRVPQVAPVWALGMTRSRIALADLGRALLLAAFTAVLAIPTGIALAWVLLAVVNVQAFGWRLPLLPDPAGWLRLAIWSMVAAGLAAALPAWRLWRMAPADLVKVFAHER